VTAGSLADRYPGLDPELRAVLEQAAAAGLAPLPELSPQEARARTRLGNVGSADGPRLASVTDVLVGTGLIGRLYRPVVPPGSGTVVYFHGGGWVTGDLDYADEICRLIARDSGAAVLSVDYRLAPEHRFPAAVQDAMTALAWAASAESGLRRPLVVAGDSAGGNLAAACARELRGELAGQLLIYPVLDDDVTTPSYQRNSGLLIGAAEMTWFFDQYCPDRALRARASFAPLRAPSLDGLPRALVVVAGHDPLRDEGVSYARRLADAGVAGEAREYLALTHGFLRFTARSGAAAAAADDVAACAAALIAGTPLPPPPPSAQLPA
jgi:acetyl esterase